jgi:hypothetical protein
VTRKKNKKKGMYATDAYEESKMAQPRSIKNRENEREWDIGKEKQVRWLIPLRAVKRAFVLYGASQYFRPSPSYLPSSS